MWPHTMGSVDLHAEPLAFQWNNEPVSEAEYDSFVKELLGGMEADIVIGMGRDESCVDHKEFWPAKEAMDILEQET